MEPPHGGTLAQWLDWQLELHPNTIELGLERVRCVAARLGVLPFATRCVVVAGTNGKGSCVHLIEALLRARGHRVGTYTSPHLWRYNERVHIAGREAGDAALCRAFGAVESARRGIRLTYFEFGTLAALWLFQRAELDYAVLEVGLGGRLDAVNIVDADVALITNIGLDHSAYLGDTREAVGAEKAGVMRGGRPVVCADRALPGSVVHHAEAAGAPMYRLGEDFDVDAEGWRGWSGMNVGRPLPPHVCSDNLAAALAVVALLDELPRSHQALEQACRGQRALHGRCEIVEDGPVQIIHDVAHNAEAAAMLSVFLRRNPIPGATHIVLGMLADKPVEAVARTLAAVADHFHAADLSAVSARGLDSTALARRIGRGARPAGPPSAALAHVRKLAGGGDRIVVCGSFFTVAGARGEAC